MGFNEAQGSRFIGRVIGTKAVRVCGELGDCITVSDDVAVVDIVKNLALGKGGWLSLWRGVIAKHYSRAILLHPLSYAGAGRPVGFLLVVWYRR